jgi:hypothetical protein
MKRKSTPHANKKTYAFKVTDVIMHIATDVMIKKTGHSRYMPKYILKKTGSSRNLPIC